MKTTKSPFLGLIPFKRIPLERVARELRKTKLYPAKLRESIIRGLSRSSLYAAKKPKVF